MPAQPLFSIVIPSYNRAHSLANAIDSVLAQSISDFEVLIVDDGSVDHTADLIAAVQDSRVRYIKQANGGATKARNKGITAARGRYIAFLDSDDTFLPRHLEQSLPVLQASEKNCVYSQVIVERGNNVRFLKPARAIKQHENISDYLLCYKGFVPTITLVLPSALANSVLYDENIGYGDDIDFAIRLAAHGGRFVMLKEPGAIWQDCWSDSRLSSTIDPQQRLAWLNKVKPLLTNKAYFAVLGRSVAKGYAQTGQKWKGFGYYFRSLWHGGFTPKTAVMYFFQILLSANQYRHFSDFLAKLGLRP
ncbi:hypothetical protein WG68_02380 [Arsukibacterium ikkense]|uniref:Glycosyltransferase 2-like domain-containing protein n=1 Tax=Arsukibacterium ikkense TaxID=336831 RepID=A0A0M2VCG0_9GAMM|nr:glycosyltransferase family 2 protein [Arsukibacterium ikkense]KKO46813.1 hypothetical protein WG68_02380 [Arsukibacterium ikkense]